MLDLTVIIRFLLFIVSNFGYYSFLRKHTRIHESFYPILTVGFQVSILFLAGLLNLLHRTADLIFLLGLLLVLQDLRKKKLSRYRTFGTDAYFYLLAGTAALALVLAGSRFTHYDNFSHWAVVVKDMLRTNRMPNFESTMIVFQAYPLGSALYIYYFCTLIGDRESFQMLAQAFMMLTAIMPLFSLVKKHRIWNLIYLLLFTNLVFVALIPLTDLLVDTLLPLFGMVSVFYIYRECRQQPSGDIRQQKTAIYLSIPLLITVVMIKNAGVLFMLMALGLLAVQWIRVPGVRKCGAAAMLSPLAALLIWERHCLYVFYGARVSKHAMTAANYRGNFAEKTAEDMAQIVSAAFTYMLRYRGLIWVLLLAAAAVLLTWLFRRERIRDSLGCAAFVHFLYGIYTLGICAMYVFSMPLGEALTLDSIDRYAGTVMIAICYVFAGFYLSIAAETEGKLRYPAVCAAMLLSLVLPWMTEYHLAWVHGSRDTEARDWMEQQILTYEIPEGASCYVFTDQSYFYYLGRYLLWSDQVAAGGTLDPEVLSQGYEYIILEKQGDMDSWILENYPDQAGQTVLRIGE